MKKILFRKKFKKNGFTIIEILVTIFVIGIGFLEMYSIFVLADTIVIRSHNTNQAYLIANQSIEQIRAKTFSSLNTETVSTPIPELTGGTLNTTISNYEADSELKEIKAEVTWLERNKLQKVEISSLATSRGINN